MTKTQSFREFLQSLRIMFDRTDDKWTFVHKDDVSRKEQKILASHAKHLGLKIRIADKGVFFIEG